jgi:hypothetical protein
MVVEVVQSSDVRQKLGRYLDLTRFSEFEDLHIISEFRTLLRRTV